MLVIGEQFQWNILYPGPDGKFGRYLLFPKTYDAKWADGKKFQGFDGPRDVPPEKVVTVINAYIASNEAAKIGKDLDDPLGKDDIWQGALARVMEVPIGRPVDVSVTAKDVIHSFSLPNFRFKMDAVPGMVSTVTFTTVDREALSKEREKLSRHTYKLDELVPLLLDKANPEQKIVISEADASQGAEQDKTGWRFVAKDPKNPSKTTTIIRDGGTILYDAGNPAGSTIERLRTAGVTQITTHGPGYFDIVCQELCGQGHYKMQGQMTVIENDEYAEKYEGKKRPAASTQPVALRSTGVSPVAN